MEERTRANAKLVQLVIASLQLPGGIQANRLVVKLSDDQWKILNEYFDQEHFEVTESGDPNSVGIVKRHGLMMFKLCMVLSAFRRYERNSTESTWQCNQDDFDNAWAIVAESMSHSHQVFKQLPGAKTPKENAKANILYDSLPEAFSTKEALEIGLKLNIPESTGEKYLRLLKGRGKLKPHSHGRYEKG